MRRGLTLAAVLMCAVILAAAGCGGDGQKTGAPTPTNPDSAPGVATAPSPNTIQPGPAQMLNSGTWRSEGPDGPWYLQAGVVYFSEIKKVDGLGAGAYEVVDGSTIRLVIFQDFGPEEDNWDPHNPATYPWWTTAVESLGPDSVRIMEPGIMHAGPMDLKRIR